MNKAIQPPGTHRTVLRALHPSTGNFLNLDDDYDFDGHNWDGTKEELIERIIEHYGRNWANSIEIQRWQITEERIDHITGDGIDYTKSF